MKRWFRFMAALVLIPMIATGCANSAAPETSKSPAADVTAPPAAETPGQAEVYMLAGKAADIQAGGKRVAGSGYFAGKGEEKLVVPFVEVCKGLGWAVTEPEAAGPVEIKMSKPGQPEIVISFTRPDVDFSPDIGTVVVKKDNKEISVNEMEKMPYIDGMLYANEGFISEAVEKIAIKYDGETLISVEPSA